MRLYTRADPDHPNKTRIIYILWKYYRGLCWLAMLATVMVAAHHNGSLLTIMITKAFKKSFSE